MIRLGINMMCDRDFLKVKCNLKVCLSISYRQSIVSNTLPQGNHNIVFSFNSFTSTVSNIKPKGNHNDVRTILARFLNVRKLILQGNRTH